MGIVGLQFDVWVPFLFIAFNTIWHQNIYFWIDSRQKYNIENWCDAYKAQSVEEMLIMGQVYLPSKLIRHFDDTYN